jgi:hypothetical protein
MKPPETPRRTLWVKLIAGAPERKTRLHDQLGRAVPLSRALRNGPRALATGMARILLGWRPERPWISYDAQRVIAAFLGPDREVLEFGSGMSTMWFARKAGHVVSIEDDEAWHAAVGERLRAFGNIDYRFSADRPSYVALAPDKAYDLIMIDGSWREDCAEFAIRHLKPGGMIYLDNSDKADEGTKTGDVPSACATLIAFAERTGSTTLEFTDFAPTQLFVQRGLMVRSG